MQQQVQREQAHELPEWQVRLRERLLTKNGEGAEAILNELSAEEALTALRDTLLPEAQRQGAALKQRNLLLLIFILYLLAWEITDDYVKIPIFSVLISLLILSVLYMLWRLRAQRSLQLWSNSYRLVPSLVVQATTVEALSPLLDLFGWWSTQEGEMSRGQKEAQIALKRLLVRVTPHEACSLTENNRLVLLRLAQNAETEVDLGIGALLTLGAMNEARVRPIAQKLTGSFLPRVREAAKECLQAI